MICLLRVLDKISSERKGLLGFVLSCRRIAPWLALRTQHVYTPPGQHQLIQIILVQNHGWKGKDNSFFFKILIIIWQTILAKKVSIIELHLKKNKERRKIMDTSIAWKWLSEHGEWKAPGFLATSCICMVDYILKWWMLLAAIWWVFGWHDGSRSYWALQF